MQWAQFSIVLRDLHLEQKAVRLTSRWDTAVVLLNKVLTWFIKEFYLNTWVMGKNAS